MLPTEGNKVKFFDEGVVELNCRDEDKGILVLSVCVPNIIFQATSPSILGAGYVDELSLKYPITIWAPTIHDSLIEDQYLDKVPHISKIINDSIKQSVQQVLSVYNDAYGVLKNKNAITMMLPMGVYIKFIYRCREKDLNKLLEGISKTPGYGITEFHDAMKEACMAHMIES